MCQQDSFKDLSTKTEKEILIKGSLVLALAYQNMLKCSLKNAQRFLNMCTKSLLSSSPPQHSRRCMKQTFLCLSCVTKLLDEAFKNAPHTYKLLTRWLLGQSVGNVIFVPLIVTEFDAGCLFALTFISAHAAL